MITAEINGDLLLTRCKNIAHGVNCQNKMRSGVAKALFTKWPEVKSSYHNICANIPLNDRLGEVQPVDCGNGIIVYNCFTQFDYGYDGSKYVSYEALRKCFKTLNLYLKDQLIAIPKIGAGLAGGDWNIIKDIINQETPDLEVHVYYL